MRHVTLAFRTLFKTPFVTGIAVVSLALGIGANAAIFSLFDQILLRPLPVPDPDQLVNLADPFPKAGSMLCSQAGSCDVVFSYPMFRDLERMQTVFAGLAAHLAFGVSLSHRDQATTGDGMYVSGSYFPTLGLRPALGRLLAPADDQSIGTNYVTVLGYGYWQSHFGSDPAILGRPLRVNGQEMTIVGVAPRGFQGTTLGVRPLVFVPISMRGVLSPGFRGFENRRDYWAYLFGRLKPGMSLAQANVGLNAVYHSILTEVEAPLQKGMSEQFMAKFRVKRVVLTPGSRGQSSMHRDAKTPLLCCSASPRSCCSSRAPTSRISCSCVARAVAWRWASVWPWAPAAGSSSPSCSPNPCSSPAWARSPVCSWPTGLWLGSPPSLRPKS